MDLLRELNLDLSGAPDGRKANGLKPRVEYAVVRELTADDVGRTAEAVVLPLAKLRERHHSVARLLAAGTPAIQVAAITGYTPVRVNSLREDPSMIELIAFYATKANEEYADMHKRLAALGVDAAEELHERLEVDPASFSNEELMSVVKTTADRTGYGPATKNLNVNVNLGMADRLEAARRRAQEASIPRSAGAPVGNTVAVVDAEVLD